MTYGEGDNYPMYYITWYDCQEFIKKLNQLTGRKFSLPTEAQWEFAARGGNKSRGTQYCGSQYISNVAWYKDNSQRKTHPVGLKTPNELQIYDMNGNVSEWCYDSERESSRNGQLTTVLIGGNTSRALRGGSFGSEAKNCILNSREYLPASLCGVEIGLRLTLEK